MGNPVVYVFGGGADRVDTACLEELGVLLEAAREHMGQVARNLGMALAAVNANRGMAPHSAPYAEKRIRAALVGDGSVVAARSRAGEIRTALSGALTQYVAAEATLAAQLSRPSAQEAVRPLAWYEAVWNAGPASQAPDSWDIGLEQGQLAGAAVRSWQALRDRTNRNATFQAALANAAAALGRIIQATCWFLPAADGPERSQLGDMPFVAAALLRLTGFGHFRGDLGVWLVGSGGSRPVARYRDGTEEWVAPVVGKGEDTTGERNVRDFPSLIEYSDGLAEAAEERGLGRIGVLRNSTPEGGNSWLVVVPGTRELFAHPNPQDYLSNLQMMADETNDLQVALTAALRALPIRPGEPVSIIGHSQGGIVAMRLAADPVLRQRVPVANVITLGSPVGQVRVEEEVRVTNMESSSDLVPALDGLANHTSENHLTVVFEPGSGAGAGAAGGAGGGADAGQPGPHDMATYLAGIEAALAADERVAAQLRAFTEAVQWNAGATTTEYVFEFRRTDLPGSWRATVSNTPPGQERAAGR